MNFLRLQSDAKCINNKYITDIWKINTVLWILLIISILNHIWKPITKHNVLYITNISNIYFDYLGNDISLFLFSWIGLIMNYCSSNNSKQWSKGVVFCHIQDALTGENDDVPNKHLEIRHRCMINRQLSRVYRVHFLYKNKPDFQYFFKSLRIILPS